MLYIPPRDFIFLHLPVAFINQLLNFVELFSYLSLFPYFGPFFSGFAFLVPVKDEFQKIYYLLRNYVILAVLILVVLMHVINIPEISAKMDHTANQNSGEVSFIYIEREEKASTFFD